MNTGLQDAYNLAWKLSLVIKGKAKASLLDTYTEERITIARNLVRSTDRVFNVVTSQRQFIKIFRLYIIPVVLKFVAPLFEKLKFIQRLAFKMISETGINYRNKMLSQNASLGRFLAMHLNPETVCLLFNILVKKRNEKHSGKDSGKFFCLFLFPKQFTKK
ncbi:FAD-dependent monooxygenase [Niabella defluvii]|nr:FAD-dependent monooxygenase [Niabella sp. I65]